VPVPESNLISPATEEATLPIPASYLSICEIESQQIWSVQGNRIHSLNAFIASVFGENSQIDRMLHCDECRLLQLWPHKAYLLSDHQTLPLVAVPFESNLTDISHGFCELNLTGESALAFIELYVSVNMNSARLRESRQIRCRFGQYSILLWWDDVDDIRILVDRSYAQSFKNYLVHLMQRHEWNLS